LGQQPHFDLQALSCPKLQKSNIDAATQLEQQQQSNIDALRHGRSELQETIEPGAQQQRKAALTQ